MMFGINRITEWIPNQAKLGCHFRPCHACFLDLQNDPLLIHWPQLHQHCQDLELWKGAPKCKKDQNAG
jgi:hypothetical protein